MIQDIAKTQLALDVLGVSKRIAELQKNAAVYITSGGGGTGGTAPGGSDTHVQFNDGGAFGGDAHFTYDKTNDVLHVHKIAGDATDGLLIESESGTDVAVLGMANTANGTWYGTHNYSQAIPINLGNTSDLSGAVEIGIKFGSDAGFNYSGLPFRLIWNGDVQTFDFDDGVTHNLMGLRVSSLYTGSIYGLTNPDYQVPFVSGGVLSSEAAFQYNPTIDQLQLSTSGSGAGILIGGDTQLYRRTTNIMALASGDSLEVPTNLAVGSTVSTNHTIYTARTVSTNTTQTGIRSDLTITGNITSTFPVAGNFSTTINAGTNGVSFSAGVFFSNRSELTQSGAISEQWGVYGDVWHRSQGDVTGFIGSGRGFVNIIAGSAGTINTASSWNGVITTNAVAQSTVTDATNASPIVITTSGAHGLSSNMSVTVAGVGGNTAANGNWVITVLTTTTFSLTGSTGSGAYTSGGTVNARNPSITTASLLDVYFSHSGIGTITNAYGLLVNAYFSTGSGTITTYAGSRINNPGSGATITTLYGHYIADLTRGSTNYGIYFAGTGTNNRIAWGGTTASIHASSTSALTLTGAVTGSSSITATTALVATTRVTSGVSTLTDGATPALDASLGNTFLLTAAGDRTIAVPTNATSGQRIIIVHKASGANRTLSLNTGAGGFRFGTDITGLTVTTSGLTDYIGCVYNSADSKWDVISYRKGY